MNTPLCVDCDGTLLKTDLLHEAVFLLAKQSPAYLFMLPFWLMRGKAYLKHQIANHVTIDFASLPIRDEIIALINSAREEGSKVILITASPQIWAEGVARHVGLFDEAIGSNKHTNLSSINKAQYLCDRFGKKQFDYVGNDFADLPVWSDAASAVVVTSNLTLIRQAKEKAQVKQVIAANRVTAFTYLKALRVHQWLKNLLVWLPLAAAHQLSSSLGIKQALIAFFSFSFCASAVYLLNDLLDLESDRVHIRKRKRPLAAGLIPILHGVLMCGALLCFAVFLALKLHTDFLIVLSFYFTMTLTYSLRLKKQVIVDVILLAGLYTIRVVAGAAATQTMPSFWLLALSMFIFLSLALIKRYSELLITLQLQKTETAGRGYQIADLPVLMSIGISAGMVAVMVLALYVNAPESTVFYKHKIWLWLAPPLLMYWISRVWMKAHRGEVDDDPVVFAVKDWQSLVIVSLLAIIVWLAA